MGRSKRARGPARPGAEPARAVQAIPARRPRWSRSGLPVVLLGLAVLGLWRWRGSGTAPGVPDPLTAEMPSPVARALRSAREAVLAEPGSARAWGEFASVCDAHHLYDAAAAAYGRARALAPDEFRWVYLLAVVRDFQGAGAEEVAALFAEAARLEPGYPPLHLRRGDALVRQGKLEEARAAYARALELDPAFAMASRNLGQVLLSLGDVRGAVAALERAAELDPADGVIASSLARAYFLAGDAERAERATEEARAKEPVYGVPDPVRFAVDGLSRAPLACDRRARESAERGDWKRALEDLRLLAEMSGPDPELEQRLAQACLHAGAAGEARNHLERALELRPASPESVGALADLAGLEERTGAVERAIELYRQALELAPGRADLQKRLGGCLGQRGDLAGAVHEFERAALALRPDAELQHNWGTALDRLGRREEACQHFRAALALEPDNASTHFNLGLALEAMGRTDEARQHYERALALDPRLPAAERLASLPGSGGRAR